LIKAKEKGKNSTMVVNEGEMGYWRDGEWRREKRKMENS